MTRLQRRLYPETSKAGEAGEGTWDRRQHAIYPSPSVSGDAYSGETERAVGVLLVGIWPSLLRTYYTVQNPTNLSALLISHHTSINKAPTS